MDSIGAGAGALAQAGETDGSGTGPAAGVMQSDADLGAFLAFLCKVVESLKTCPRPPFPRRTGPELDGNPSLSSGPTTFSDCSPEQAGGVVNCGGD